VARFVKGDIVVVPFPFSDLTQAKRRPALVLVELEGDDRILCQITSQQVGDRYAIELDDSDFEVGSLRQKSNIRPNRLFTCDIRIILYQVGHLKPDKMDKGIERIVEILRS
jgi:mRNA interferase MazF